MAEYYSKEVQTNECQTTTEEDQEQQKLDELENMRRLEMEIRNKINHEAEMQKQNAKAAQAKMEAARKKEVVTGKTSLR